MLAENRGVRLAAWLTIALAILLLGGRAAWAAAVPTALVPASAHNEFIGENFTLPNPSADPPSTDSICFDNTGDTTGLPARFRIDYLCGDHV